MANVVIEHNAVIGNNVRIHPSTTIGWDCIIGNDCLILSNTVIGSKGFGYSQDQFFNHHRIPQTGNVVIGNKVTIGATNTVDRGLMVQLPLVMELFLTISAIQHTTCQLVKIASYFPAGYVLGLQLLEIVW